MAELNGRLARWGLLSLGCNGAIVAHRARRSVFMVGWTMPCRFPLLRHTSQIYVKEVWLRATSCGAANVIVFRISCDCC